jgi:hypothetical protein
MIDAQTNVRLEITADDVLLLYHSDALFQFVPKRCLQPAHIEAIRRLYRDAAQSKPGDPA